MTSNGYFDDNKNELKLLLTIFILAVVLRVICPLLRETLFFHKSFITYGESTMVHKSFIAYGGNAIIYNSFNDEYWYNLTAKSLVNAGRYGINIADPYAKRLVNDFPGYFKKINEVHGHKVIPPFYPYFLAVLYCVFGFSTLAYFIPQVILGAFTCILIYYIAFNLFNNRQVAIVSSCMVAFYPDLIFWTYAARVETLFIFLLAFLFFALSKAATYTRRLNAFFVGILLGVIVLTRLTFLFFVPVLIIWLFFYLRKERKQILMWLLILTGSFLLTLLPWAIRNFIVFNTFTVMTDEVGAIVLGFSQGQTNPYYMIPSNSISQSSYIGLWIKYIMQNPIEFLSLTESRLIKYLSPVTEPMRGIAKIYKWITWTAVFPAFFLGLLLSIKNNWRRAGLLILFIIYYTLIHSLSFVDDGLIYRYPIQPFICIFAAYTFWLLCNKYCEKTI